ncbi:hypothetical protein [Mariniradius saccharolyticus]|uniref:hypothetical protein n=1 Tax=Mariniradius saccharolyticus TaxID=1245591 RepID=UPI0009DAE6B5|nr:hypothetical protein [Mariniradius saccharolyticus]
MKKISLEMLRLSSDEVLERSQMKKITGGYGGGILIGPGTCGWRDRDGYPVCNISSGSAQMLNRLYPGGNWCCESCQSRGGSAGYC